MYMQVKEISYKNEMEQMFTVVVEVMVIKRKILANLFHNINKGTVTEEISQGDHISNNP